MRRTCVHCRRHAPHRAFLVFLVCQIVVLLVGVVWVVMPCRCGKTARLTATGRLYHKGSRKLLIKNVLLAGGLTSLFFAVALIPGVVARIIGMRGAVHIVPGMVFFVLGCVTLTASALNKLPKLPGLRYAIPEAEIQEITALKGETEEELTRLIDLHFRLGNYQEADLHSRKLLELAEQGLRHQ